jgi:hypothetical protein
MEIKMAKAKLTGLKKGIQPRTKIPFNQSNGNVGKWAEDQLIKNGYNVQKNSTLDIPDIGVEVKTRKHGSKSCHSMGGMSIERIISTPYDQSTVKEKILSQYRMHYHDQFQEVSDSGVYNFDEKYIQEKMREAYEGAREMIMNGDRKNWIRKEIEPGKMAWGAFERNGNSYVFRIPPNRMNDMEYMSKSTYNKNFVEID